MAEFAVVLPVLVLFTVAMVWMVCVGLTQVRAIDAALRQAEYRQRFELVQQWAHRVDEPRVVAGEQLERDQGRAAAGRALVFEPPSQELRLLPKAELADRPIRDSSLAHALSSARASDRCARPQEGEHCSRVCVPPRFRESRELRRADQGCEMGIGMRQQLARHMASAARDLVLEDRGRGRVHRLVAALLPNPIERVKPGRSERSARASKAPEVVRRPVAVDLVLLPEVPAQLGHVV